MNDTAYYTTQELAAMLRCTREKVYDMARNREMPSTKVGATLLFDVKAIQTWLAERTRPVKHR